MGRSPFPKPTMTRILYNSPALLASHPSHFSRTWHHVLVASFQSPLESLLSLHPVSRREGENELLGEITGIERHLVGDLET